MIWFIILYIIPVVFTWITIGLSCKSQKCSYNLEIHTVGDAVVFFIVGLLPVFNICVGLRSAVIIMGVDFNKELHP